MRSSALAAIVATALLLSGCSDDPSDDVAPGSAASADADAATTLIQTGLDQMAAGDDSAARTTFENVLALDPANVYALYNLGVIAQNADSSDEAIDYYDQALVAQPDYTPALYNKAILLETRDLDQSVQLYRQVIGVDDQLAAAYMRLGFALVHLGETEEGEGYLEQGIMLDPAMKDVDAPRYD